MSETITPTEIAEQIESGDEIVVDTSRPEATLEALKKRDDLTDAIVTLFGYPYEDFTVFKELSEQSGISVQLSMVPPDARSLVSEGVISYVPRTVYQAAIQPNLESGRRTVGIVQIPSSESDNLYSLGCLSTFGKTLLETADISIVEENPNFPTTARSETVSPDKINYATTVETAPPTLTTTVTEVADDVAHHLVSIIPDNATIQLGVGNIMEAVGTKLVGGGPYKLWTGLLGESARPLFEENVISDATCCVAIGSENTFYEWVSGLDDVEFVSGSISHSPTKLATQSNLIAINSALQVDLYGQVNAETLGGKQVAGVGGQSSFMNAASNNSDGLAIIALTSQARNGTSKIIDMLPSEEVVTTPRYAVDAVVTEYGIAQLNGSVEKRAEALIDIAHPSKRESLRKMAHKRDII